MHYSSLVSLWLLFSHYVVYTIGFIDRKMDGVYPPPFWRELQFQNPIMKGNDVTILQGLLVRFNHRLVVSGSFDNETRQTLSSYQTKNGLESTGRLDVQSAVLVLNTLMYDHYQDDGTVPHNYKFKLYIPVYKNRSIETKAKLYDSDNKVLHAFTVRTHGSHDLNQLSTNGNTPTGLATCDLNSPEPITKSFGPYPVLRQVKGLLGNVAIGPNPDQTLIPYIRYGILLHTGEWKDWNTSQPMPNSNGCIHAHPSDQKRVVDILTNDLGVEVRKNPFGEVPYPYKPQGLLSIEQIDEQ